MSSDNRLKVKDKLNERKIDGATKVAPISPNLSPALTACSEPGE